MPYSVNQFGMVTVYADTGVDGNKPKKIQINWSCKGAVSVEEAKQFHKDFAEAIAFAEEEEAHDETFNH